MVHILMTGRNENAPFSDILNAFPSDVVESYNYYL